MLSMAAAAIVITIILATRITPVPRANAPIVPAVLILYSLV